MAWLKNEGEEIPRFKSDLARCLFRNLVLLAIQVLIARLIAKGARVGNDVVPVLGERCEHPVECIFCVLIHKADPFPASTVLIDVIGMV